MVDTPPSKPQSGPAPGPGPEPFKRGQIIWSRPPQEVFRVGPPPRMSAPVPAQPQRQVAQAPRRASGAGILSGSMIPKAGPASTPARPQIETATLPTPKVEAVPASVLPPVDSAAPVVPRPQPEVAAVEAARPPEPAADAPRVVVPVAVSEPVVPSSAAAVRHRTGVPSAVWIGGALVALLLAAVAGWWLLKPDAPVPAPVNAATPTVEAAPAQAATEPVAVPVDAVPITEDVVDAAEVEAVPTTTRPSTTPAPTTAAPVRAAPTTAAPSMTPRLNIETSVPRIDTAPLVVAPVAPPPTAAERPATDPDSPIQTRPQPLN